MIQQQFDPSHSTMSSGTAVVEFNQQRQQQQQQYYSDSASNKKQKRNLLLLSIVAIIGAVLLLVLSFPLVRKLFFPHNGHHTESDATPFQGNFHRKHGVGPGHHHHGERPNSIDHHYNSIHLKNRQIHIPSTEDHFKRSHGPHGGNHLQQQQEEFSSSIIKLFRLAISFLNPSPNYNNNENGANNVNSDTSSQRTFLLHFKKNYDNRVHVSGGQSSTSEKEFESWLERGLKQFNVRLGHYIPHRTFMISGSEGNVWRARDWINSELSGLSWLESLLQSEEDQICWIGPVESKDKSVSDDVLEVHLDKTVLVERVMRGDTPYDDAFRYMTRKLLANDDKGKDVHFIVTANVAKHESKEELEKSELLNENSEIMQRLKKLDIVNVRAVSNSKIAIGVNGHKDAIKVAQDLKEHGLVHWVEVKTPTITHGKYSNGLVQSYKKPTEKPIWNMGITGKGQVIGVGDTGVDYYHCFFYDESNDPPFQTTLASASATTSSHRKFKSFWAYMDKVDSTLGHGTHVAGIAAGKAHTLSNPTTLQEHNSLAQDAKLAFMDAGCDTIDSCKCPADVLCECDMKEGKVCPKKFGVVYLPLDLYESYFPYFYQNGAKVVSSSWGTGFFRDFGFGYSTNSREIDMFAWEKKDFLPVFAAGNSGGVFGYASLTSEAESKNGLSIGASLSTYQSFEQTVNFTSTQMIIDRLRIELYQRFCQKSSDLYDAEKCTAAQQFSSVDDCCNNGGTCSTISSTCCGVQKFAPFTTIGFRCCPDCIRLEMKEHPEYYSQENLAVFTARGPTLDNRIKPDVVTVGEKILSSRSAGTESSKKCGSSEFTKVEDQMIYHEGTSMAAPLAAASAVLIRQFYQDGYLSGAKDATKGFNPSAALIKATLIHSAKALTGYVHLLSKHMYWPLQYKDGHTFALQSTYMQGFGRTDLSNVMDKSMGLYVPNKEDAQLSTGQAHQYCLNVKSQSTNPLKVTIVWTDPPSSPAAKIHLVNDLDLVVVTPSGDKLFGNGGKSSVKQTRDEPDQLNNVEQVEMETTDPVGKYNIIVRGNAVTKGPQPYAIVITGDFELTSGCPAYSFIPYAYLAERVETYSNLSVAFGILSVICIPSLAFLSIYLYLQYRKITTANQGYRSAEIGQNTRTYVDLGDDDNLELKNLRNYEVNNSDDDEDNSEINRRGGTASEKAQLGMTDRD